MVKDYGYDAGMQLGVQEGGPGDAGAFLTQPCGSKQACGCTYVQELTR